MYIYVFKYVLTVHIDRESVSIMCPSRYFKSKVKVLQQQIWKKHLDSYTIVVFTAYCAFASRNMIAIWMFELGVNLEEVYKIKDC